jgi:probable F420-dependent oxidoreductase
MSGAPVIDGMKVRFAVAPQSGLRDAGELIAFAEAVEAHGFDGVWLSDLPVGPGVDPLLGLALIAGRTDGVRLGANVVPLGRNPFLLAKALAQLDQISGGRLLLSFVPGLGQPSEREALGWEGADRGAVLEGVLGVVRSWWAGEPPLRETPHEGLAELVRPLQDPLEVWLGGRGPKALERIGRIADGWLGALVTPEEAGAARATIQSSAERAGRWMDPEHFGLSIAYSRSAPEPGVLRDLSTRREGVDPLALLPVGVDGLRSLLSRHLDAGLSKFVLRPATRVTSWRDEARWLADAILDLQT